MRPKQTGIKWKEFFLLNIKHEYKEIYCILQYIVIIEELSTIDYLEI